MEEVMIPRRIKVEIRKIALISNYLNPARPTISLDCKDYNNAPLTHTPLLHNSKIREYRELSAECILSDLRTVKDVK